MRRWPPGRRGEEKRRVPGARHEASGGRGRPQGAAAGGAAAVMDSGSAASRLPCGASARARPAGTAREDPGAVLQCPHRLLLLHAAPGQ